MFPVRISKLQDAHHTVRLLQLNSETICHYVLITNFSKFIRSQVTKHRQQTYFCDFCLHGCTTEQILKKHMERCQKFRSQNVFVPEKNDFNDKDKLKFTKFEHQLPLPYIILADFESVLEKVSTTFQNPNTSNTTIYQKHIPCGAAYKIVSSDPCYYHEPVIVTGTDCAVQFLDRIQADVDQLRKFLRYF